MLRFWTRNVPHMGLSHPFVLHFVLALAAFHLAYLGKREIRPDDILKSSLRPRRSPSGYLTIAQKHFTAGVSGFSSQLSEPSPDNCGALYLGAVLTSYCTFADGPTSRDDLLVCTGKPEGGGHCDSENAETGPAAAASFSSPNSQMPFVIGVRLMHQSFSSDVLFAGLMEPLLPGPLPPLENPIYARDDFSRLDWEEALDGLREFIASEGKARDGTPTRLERHPAEKLSLKALDDLIGIYAAIYGRRGPEGEIMCNGPPQNQFVFGWLYRVQLEFAGCVRRHDPYALLVLAHFAVLLDQTTIQKGWYIEGWKKHIVARVGELLGSGRYSEWMRWPIEQAV